MVDTPIVFELVAAGLAAVVFFGLVSMFVGRYKRCPSNQILVVSGNVGQGSVAKCISGGGTFVWPVIQEYAYLSLEPIRIDVPLTDALSLENIRLSVPSVFTVAVGTDTEIRQNAAMRLLGLSSKDIQETAHDIIVGQMRQVIAGMKIDEVARDRDSFLHRIQHQLEPELKKLGLVVINVNITDLKDSAGYLEALSKQATQQAIQQARGDVAEQEKLGEVRVASALRDKTVQVADADKQRQLGLREMQRDQAVRMAEMDKEQQVAEQTAAFQREAQVKDADFKKRVAIAEADAKAVAGEAQSRALVVAAQAQLQVKTAESYRIGETSKREADAAVAEAQNRAMAKAALAEAERVEAEQRAKLEAPAKAEKARTIVEAEAAAERRRIEANAEAAAIYAKLEAEARGQFEIMSKKADGLARVVAAAGGDARAAFQLLMVEQIPMLADSAARAVQNIKFDKVVVWDGGHQNGGPGGAAGFVQNVAHAVPPIMQVLKDVAGIDLPPVLGAMKSDELVEK